MLRLRTRLPRAHAVADSDRNLHVPAYMVYIARPILALTLALSHIRPALAAQAQTHLAQCAIPTLSTRPFSSTPPTSHMSSEDPTSTSSATPQPAPPQFLQDRLSTLLASPYIHFKKPTSGPLLGLRMGPGPVDLFSTRFANFFTHAATGVVAGTEVDRDGLKDALLALQRRWDPNSASFSSVGAVGDAQVRYTLLLRASGRWKGR